MYTDERVQGIAFELESNAHIQIKPYNESYLEIHNMSTEQSITFTKQKAEKFSNMIVDIVDTIKPEVGKRLIMVDREDIELNIGRLEDWIKDFDSQDYANTMFRLNDRIKATAELEVYKQLIVNYKTWYDQDWHK